MYSDVRFIAYIMISNNKERIFNQRIMATLRSDEDADLKLFYINLLNDPYLHLNVLVHVL